jgi:hypothetical protein
MHHLSLCLSLCKVWLWLWLWLLGGRRSELLQGLSLSLSLSLSLCLSLRRLIQLVQGVHIVPYGLFVRTQQFFPC